MGIVAIIPARGRSKGIPRKNVVGFAGRPLVEWSIIDAQQTQAIDVVCVSTDNDRIEQVAEKAGARVIRRPAELATHAASSESALLHALDTLEEGGMTVDVVVFLQATSPLREAEDVEAAIVSFREHDYDSLFSACVLKDYCIWKMDDEGPQSVTYDWTKRSIRQQRTSLFLENGSFWLFRPAVLRATGNRLGGRIGIYETPFWKSFEIDTSEDLKFCEHIFRWKLGWKLRRSLPPVDLLVMDFDGVMTDNRVMVDDAGRESVVCNRADGLGIDMLREAGMELLVLSTERSAVVQARAAKLGIPCAQGIRDKAEFLTELCRERGVALERVAFVGNDLNDVPTMRKVGLAIAPADAYPAACEAATLVLGSEGGRGVIRELAGLMLQTGG